MNRICQACAQDVRAGQEICPHCLAPLVSATCRFTQETTEAGSHSPTNHKLTALPDIEAVNFAPASPLYRAFSQLKGGLLSALVALIFVSIGGAWWVHSHRGLASEKSSQAQVRFEKGEYVAAVECWQQALEAYHQSFDRPGQIEALLGLSRCHIRTKDFSEALVVLQRAQKIQDTESVKDALKKCHRMAAVEHLRLAQELYTPDSFGKAYLEAELAIDGFENGEGSGAQKAGAYRMAARCSVELEDFEGAQNYLEQALECEGKSRPNLALQSEIKKQYAAHRSKMLADAGANGYIPRGKLDPIAIEKAAAKRSSYDSTSYQRRSTSYSNYKPLTYSIPQYNPPPRRLETTVGSGAAYPTNSSRYQTYNDPMPSYSQPHIPSGLPQSHRGALERAYSRPSSGRYQPRIITPTTGYRPPSRPSNYRAPAMPPSSYSPPNPYGR